MKYNNIKRILRNQIENKVLALWTYDENKNEFTHIYKSYSNDLKIYTTKQLIDYLNERETEETQ